MPPNRLRVPLPQAQSGAVLFVGMMILILLTLIAVTSSQGSLMQERMASNFLLQNQAFENAEGQLPLVKVYTADTASGRQADLSIRLAAQVQEGVTYVDPAEAWLGTTPPATSMLEAERLDLAAGQTSLSVGTSATLLTIRATAVGISAGSAERRGSSVTQEIFVP